MPEVTETPVYEGRDSFKVEPTGFEHLTSAVQRRHDTLLILS
jgi:hypothetical protein